MMKGMGGLSPRLQAVCKMIPTGDVADIGTDHAQLPIALADSGWSGKIIASEVQSGPFLRAQHEIRRSGWQKRIELRYGDGLSVLAPGEVGTIVLAGMGGGLIATLLQAAPQVAGMAKTIVLQPMQGADILRRWLVGAGYQLRDEDLAKEGAKLYEVIAAGKGRQVITEELLFEIGPCLWDKRHPLLPDLIRFRLHRYGHAVAALENAKRPGAVAHRASLIKKMARLEEMLRCISR